jgi:uncharacterized membrane protein YqjE
MVNQTQTVNVSHGPVHALVDRLTHFAGTAMELAMLQGELAVDDARRARKRATYAVFMIVAAGALMISALPILGGAFVAILVLFARWPVWVAALAVSIAFLAIAGLLFWVAWLKLRGATGAFDASRREASTNLQWLRESLATTRNGA